VKIGVYYGAKPPMECGGYTFETSIGRELMGASGHEYIFFVPRALVPEVQKRAVRVVPVDAIWGRRFTSGVKRLFNKIANGIGLPSFFRRTGWLDDLIVANQVEFFFNLTPFQNTEIVPYLTVIWDLQHRKQPFFPETTAEGRWVLWEAKFSRLTQRAAGIVCGTPTAMRELTRFYGIDDARIHVVPFPVPENFQRAHPVTTCGDSNVRPYVFYPASYWPHKNHVNLLLGLHELRKRNQLDFDLICVGQDGGNLTYLRNFARELNISDHVQFLGYVSDERMVQLYRQALLLVYVTLFGPDNFPPLEAFAAECPVVVGKWDGAEEQLGNAALYVDATDPMQIADAILRMRLDADLRAEHVRRGLELANRRTCRAYIASLEQIFDYYARIRRNWGPSAMYRNYPLLATLRRLFGVVPITDERRSIWFVAADNHGYSGQREAVRLVFENLNGAFWRPGWLLIPAIDRRRRDVVARLLFPPKLLFAWLRYFRLCFTRAILHISLAQSRFGMVRDVAPLLLARLLGARSPAVVSLNGGLFEHWTFQQWESRLLRTVVTNATAVTVVTEFQREAAIELGLPPEKVRVVQNSCERINYSESAIISKHSESGPIRVLFLSNLIAAKGYPIYLGALEALGDSQGRPIEAVLCGPVLASPYSTEFPTVRAATDWINRCIARINLSSRVRITWTRGASGDEKWDLFRQSHIFVLPTSYAVEAQPISIIEAMAFGCCVISTDLPGVACLFDSGSAVLMKQPTIASLQVEIERLTADSGLRSRMAIGAFNHYNETIALDEYVARWTSLLMHLNAGRA
jgi:glycosyltransferase involved in cell wall biosynthesis